MTVGLSVNEAWGMPCVPLADPMLPSCEPGFLVRCAVAQLFRQKLAGTPRHA